MRLRLAGIAVIAAAATAVFAVPARAETVSAQAKAQVIKPLTLSSLQNLDLGTMLLAPGTWSGAKVSLSRSGALTCPANVTCSGATQVARYNVAGSNKQTVIIHTPDVTLVNQADTARTLTLVIDSPGSLTLTNSGVPGTNFDLGGSITLDSATAEGTYVGTFNVSVEYQ